jgi:hypothetical protein
MPRLLSAGGFTRVLDSEPVANEARAVQPYEQADHAPGHNPDHEHEPHHHEWWEGIWQIERKKPHDQQGAAADGSEASTSA